MDNKDIDKSILMELKEGKWSLTIKGINPIEALRAGNILITEALVKIQDVPVNKVETPRITIPRRDLSGKVITLN